MSRPKIVVAVDSFLPRWDGVARALSELLPVLAQHATIRFLIPDYPGKRPALPGVEYVTYPLYPYLRLSDAGCPRVSNSRIRPHIAWCDVVWTHSAGPIGGRCLELGHAHGKRCVSMIHSMEWDVYSENLPFGQSWGRRYWLNHVRAIYNESHHLMTPSDSTQRALLELGFTSPIVTTPLGVDCTLFHPPTDEHRMSLRRGQGLEPETPVIGYLGRFGKEKSLTTLLDAFERVTREHRATLLLVGGTAEDLSISTLPDHVRVVGPTKQANLFFAMMDIFVLPSLTESFPLSILEAMATGVTPVSTPVGAVPSYLTSETNGLLFEPKDADALEDHLTALLANSDLRAQLGSAARETVAGHYSWEAATQRMIPILRPEDS